MQNFLKRDILFLLLVILLVKIVTIACMGALPPMENQYIAQAGKLFFTNEKIYIALAPGYSFLLFCFYSLTGSWAIASKLIFVLFSFLTSLVLFQWAKEMWNERTAKIILLLSVFMPALTVTYAGYTHSVVAGLFFFTTACYCFWKLMSVATWKNAGCFTLFALLSVLIRPELLVIFSGFIGAWICKIIFFKTENKKASFAQAGFVIACVVCFLFLHKSFIASRNADAAHSGIFSDSRYSYRTFTHIFCVRENVIIVDSVAEQKAKVFFGTAEENNYSVAKAIQHNPKKYIDNILFNLKRSLGLIPHPLVIPFFIFFFAGLGVFNSQLWKLKYVHLFLASIILLTVFTHSLFHVQIKYLANVSLPILLWTAFGISQMENKKLRNISVAACVAGLFLVYAMYLIYFMDAGARG